MSGKRAAIMGRILHAHVRPIEKPQQEPFSAARGGEKNWREIMVKFVLKVVGH